MIPDVDITVGNIKINGEYFAKFVYRHCRLEISCKEGSGAHEINVS